VKDKDTVSVHREWFYTEIHGCKNCIWFDTKHCPFHDDGVGCFEGKDRFHANRMCRYKMLFVEETKEGVLGDLKLTYNKEVLFKEMLDESWIAAHHKKRAVKTESDEDWGRALSWSKHVADIKIRWLKHVEGSIVSVNKTSISPSQYQDMIKNINEEKVVDAEYEVIEVLEDEENQ
jgi:hypothetical protein